MSLIGDDIRYYSEREGLCMVEKEKTGIKGKRTRDIEAFIYFFNIYLWYLIYTRHILEC